MIDTKLYNKTKPTMQKCAKIAQSIGLTPNTITCSAIIIGTCSAGLYVFGLVYLSVFLLLVSGFLDMLDGALARLNTPTKRGALLDLVGDRVVELAWILALSLHVNKSAIIFLLVAFVFSISVFLSIGALSEQKSHKSFFYAPGLIERSETFIFIIFMAIFSPVATYTCIIFGILVFISAFLRFKNTYFFLD